MNKVQRLKKILWSITGIGLAVAAARMFYGLGATTNLSDGVPWGLWVGFDVMGGVALAAGGFVITATVYIFKKEEFHPIVKPAVLTAFLGYLAVIVGLMFDLGMPWHIWRPMVNWQHHSVMFEVAWCVMLYTTVLALEFSPIPLEETSRYARIRSFLIKIRLPLVILGICLSTLHQSSLGSLFLIMQHNIHPLWYSPILPPLFFISAVGIGLLVVTLENLFTSYVYDKPPETNLLIKIGKGARWVLLLYLAVRIGDLVIRGKTGFMFENSWYTLLFWSELFFAAILPAVMLFNNFILRSNLGQWIAALSGVGGFVLNRINVSGLAQIREGVPFYFPSWGEFAVSAGVVSGAILLFLFAVENLKVWELPSVPGKKDSISSAELRYVKPPKAFFKFPNLRFDSSMAFVVFAAFGFSLVSSNPEKTRGLEQIPVHSARGGDTLWIDGNVDGYGAVFTHQLHMKGYYRKPECIDCHGEEPVFEDSHKIGESANDPSCVRCHHLNLPRDKNTTCTVCHRDMYNPTDVFNHDWHTSPKGADLVCINCHHGDKPKTDKNTKQCVDCHDDLIPEGSNIQFSTYEAMGYVRAMHRLCIGCHNIKVELTENPDLARCVTCHPGTKEYIDATDIIVRTRQQHGSRVIVPMLK